MVANGQRTFEVIVNGVVVASRPIEGDGSEQELEFDIAVDQSSWIATRIFPHMHTNPIEVHVAVSPSAPRAIARVGA